MSKTIHVEPSPNGWAVKQGSAHAGSYRTKAEALEAAREIARRTHAEQVVHSREGRIEERNSYRHDPFPLRRGG